MTAARDPLAEALVEAMARAMHEVAERQDMRPPFNKQPEITQDRYRREARAALAALVKVAGGADALRYGAGCVDEVGNHPDEDALMASINVPALLRALAGAADG